MDINTLKSVRDNIDKMIECLKPTSNFKISIDDGSCEFQYPIDIDGSYSIKMVHDGICEHFNTPKHPGTRR